MDLLTRKDKVDNDNREINWELEIKKAEDLAVEGMGIKSVSEMISRAEEIEEVKQKARLEVERHKEIMEKGLAKDRQAVLRAEDEVREVVKEQLREELLDCEHLVAQQERDHRCEEEERKRELSRRRERELGRRREREPQETKVRTRKLLLFGGLVLVFLVVLARQEKIRKAELARQEKVRKAELARQEEACFESQDVWSGDRCFKKEIIRKFRKRGLVLIPAGEFWMGSNDKFGWGSKDQHQPKHRVKITKSFYMAKTEVTQELWMTVMGSNPSHFKGDNLPVERVSWYDAIRFLNKLSLLDDLEPVYHINGNYDLDYKLEHKKDSNPKGLDSNLVISWDRTRNGYALPTEAEFEYAAKAGTEFKYAGSNDLAEVAWHSDNSGNKTHPVGQKKPNSWGLYDLTGNVWEWVFDSWDSEAYSNRKSGLDSPVVNKGVVSRRVLRGGGWIYVSDGSRVSFRFDFEPSIRRDIVGFRFRGRVQ